MGILRKEMEEQNESRRIGSIFLDVSGNPAHSSSAPSVSCMGYYRMAVSFFDQRGQGLFSKT